MKDRASPENHIVADLDIAGQQAVIGDHGAVSDIAVVTEMSPGHQHVVIADACGRPLGGSPVNGDIFPEDVVITYNHPAPRLGAMSEILRRGTDDGTIADQIPRPQSNMTREDGAGLDGAVVADDHIRFDDGTGTDGDTLAKRCPGVDNCSGVDVQERFNQTVCRMRGRGSFETFGRGWNLVNPKRVSVNPCAAAPQAEKC